jgi:hypothetical protein
MHGLQYGKVCRSLFLQHLANTIQLSTQLLIRADLGAKRKNTRLATRGFLLPKSGSSVVCGFHEWTTYGSLAGSFSHRRTDNVALPAPFSSQHVCARPPALPSSASSDEPVPPGPGLKQTYESTYDGRKRTPTMDENVLRMVYLTSEIIWVFYVPWSNDHHDL